MISDVTPSFPTSGWAVIGVLFAAFAVIGKYIWKLFQQLREDHSKELQQLREDNQSLLEDNKALRDRIMNDVIPVLVTATSALQASNEATQKALEVVAVNQAMRHRDTG